MSAALALTPEASRPHDLHDARWRRFRLLMVPGWHGSGPALRGFAPIPGEQLPFASRVVASDNDPCCTPVRAEQLASQWGSDLVVIPGGGHLNVQSRLGDWSVGQHLLHDLVWRRRAG